MRVSWILTASVRDCFTTCIYTKRMLLSSLRLDTETLERRVFSP